MPTKYQILNVLADHATRLVLNVSNLDGSEAKKQKKVAEDFQGKLQDLEKQVYESRKAERGYSKLERILKQLEVLEEKKQLAQAKGITKAAEEYDRAIVNFTKMYDRIIDEGKTGQQLRAEKIAERRLEPQKYREMQKEANIQRMNENKIGKGLKRARYIIQENS